MDYINKLANEFLQATEPANDNGKPFANPIVTELEVEDFLTSFLREYSDVLSFPLSTISDAMCEDWLATLPSARMYTTLIKAQRCHDIKKALARYMSARPEIFQHSNHGWRVDRKQFFDQRADIITV